MTLEQLSAIRVDLVSLSAAVLGLLLLLLLYRAGVAGFSCLDLITDKGSGKLSLTKTMNLLGGCVASWVVMRMAIDKSLTEWLLAVYLAYCAGTHGFSTFLAARYNLPTSSSSKTPAPASSTPGVRT